MRFNDIKKIVTESKEQLEDRLYDLEAAIGSARNITKQIKYASTHMDVIRELENLAEEVGIELDEYNVRQVYQANNDLESAVYELESAFEEAKRDVQMELDELDLEMNEGKDDSWYAYKKAEKKWAKDTGQPKEKFAYAGVDVQDEYIEPEMKKYGLVPDSYQGKGVTKYRRESLEALARHVKEGVPLVDSLFRYQSEAYFDTFKQAKQLREMGSLPELDWESEEMLGTDIGESVELKGVGRVWLDVPYLDESDDYEMATCDYCHGNEWDPDGPQDDDDHDDCPKCAGTGEIPKDDLGGSLTSESMQELRKLAGINENNADAEKRRKKEEESFDASAEQSREEEAYNELMSAYKKGGEEAYAEACCLSMEELDKQMTEISMDLNLHMDDDRDEIIQRHAEDTVDDANWKDHGEPEVEEGYDDVDYIERHQRHMAPIRWANKNKPKRCEECGRMEKDCKCPGHDHELTDDLNRMRDLAGIEESNPKRERAAKILHDLVEPDIDNFESRDALEQFMSDNMPEFYRGRDTGKAIEDAIELLSPNHKIPEAEYQGKKVELNKPKRGGSKKYYVYVKTPKGNVKKISFGDPGLKTKSGNKARAKSFAARHNCEKKNDKQKAGYWACRLPRYGLVKGGKWW